MQLPGCCGLQAEHAGNGHASVPAGCSARPTQPCPPLCGTAASEMAERAADMQAEPVLLVLQIITELPPDHPVSTNGSPLKDTLGHTPLQVGGGRRVAAGSCMLGMPAPLLARGQLRSSSSVGVPLLASHRAAPLHRVQVAVGFVVGVLVGYLVGLAYSL